MNGGIAMGIKPLSHGPVNMLSKRVRKLEIAFEQLLVTFHYDAHKGATRLHSIDAFHPFLIKFDT